MTSVQDLATAIRDVILSMAPASSATDQVGDPRLIEDLGYDSLGLFEMVVVLESELGIQIIDDAEIADIRRVSELQQYVLGLIDQPG
jgi:acyl carrier protein